MQHPFRNPFDHEERFTISTEDSPGLRIVTDLTVRSCRDLLFLPVQHVLVCLTVCATAHDTCLRYGVFDR